MRKIFPMSIGLLFVLAALPTFAAPDTLAREEAACRKKYNATVDIEEKKYNKINNDRRQPLTRKQVAAGAFDRAEVRAWDALQSCLARARTPERILERTRQQETEKFNEKQRTIEKKYQDDLKEAGRIRKEAEREQARKNAVRDHNAKIDIAQKNRDTAIGAAEEQYKRSHTDPECDQLAARRQAMRARYDAAVIAAGDNIDAQKAAVNQYFKDDEQLSSDIARCTEQKQRVLSTTTGTVATTDCVAQDTNAKKTYDEKIIAAITTLNDTLDVARRNSSVTQTSILATLKTALDAALMQERGNDRQTAVEAALTVHTDQLKSNDTALGRAIISAINALLQVRNEAFRLP